MGWQFLGGCPLTVPNVGAPENSNLPIAVWLTCTPFHCVVTVLRFLQEGPEFAARVPPPSNINDGYRPSPAGKVHPPAVVGIGDIWSRNVDDRHRRASVCRGIYGRMEMDAVPQRNSDAPLQFDARLLPDVRHGISPRAAASPLLAMNVGSGPLS